jgi:hypothetical protein
MVITPTITCPRIRLFKHALNSKGIANQTGSESCVAHREVRDEALTGEPAGQPLSREIFKLVQGADAVSVVEGNTDRRVKASACSTLRGLRTWHVGTLFAREPGDLLLGRFSCFRAVRIGKARTKPWAAVRILVYVGSDIVYVGSIPSPLRRTSGSRTIGHVRGFTSVSRWRRFCSSIRSRSTGPNVKENGNKDLKS